MKKAGDMFILDGDDYFDKFFTKTKDQFEITHLEAMYPFVKKWDVALDCGSHYGSWSRYMAKKFKHVLAIEGNEDIYKCLVANTKHLPNVHAKNVAVGDKHGINVSVGPGDQYDNSGCGMVIGDGKTMMMTIDSMDLPGLDLLKIDVEGMEYATLIGGQRTIKKFKPVILFEDKGHSERYGIATGKTAELLQSWGAKERLILSKRDFIYSW